MIMRFSDEFMVKGGDAIFDYVSASFTSVIVNYIINSKYRTAVNLTSWVAEQLNNPCAGLIRCAEEIKENNPNKLDDYDFIAHTVLQYVRSKATYITDSGQWKLSENWQTIEQSLKTWKGDCEDFALVIYVLCRYLGIPHNRLLIGCGDVRNGAKLEGHAFCMYRPENYPLNFVMLDWCYFVDLAPVGKRSMFSISSTNDIQQYDVFGGEWVDQDIVNYVKLWFAFNENSAYLQMKPKWL
jgi:predicted transglutaminase-like cysteine proteinase